MTAAPDQPPELEDLVARAIELLDAQDDAGLRELLARWPHHAAEIERVLACANANGLAARPGSLTFPDRLGDFRLIRRLGAGGMGIVFEAEQVSLRRRVAVKVIRTVMLLVPGARLRFQREVEAVARLQHPGITKVLAVGEADGVPYFAMELVLGCGSDAVVAQHSGQDPARLDGAAWGRTVATVLGSTVAAHESPPQAWWQVSARLALEVATAMAHAHASGIVHRDLKPSNIMVTVHGAAQVVDFGLAHIDSAQRLTHTGSQQGSPAYMSPEQIRGIPVDERTDVYSLGATLYEWVTLRAPFGGATIEAVKASALKGAATPLRRLCRNAPHELEVVCAKAMDLDRERRYPSMAAFAADLGAVLANRPIQAQRTGVGLRLWRWGQRHRSVAVALATGASVFVTLLLVLVVYQRQANTRLRQEVDRAQRNLGISIEAVDYMLSSLGNDDAPLAPGTELLQLQVFDAAVALHRRLIEHQSDTPELRFARANALYCQARTLSVLERPEAAASAYREAIALLGGEDLDVDIETLDKRARVHSALGYIKLSQGQLDAAEDLAALARREFAAVLAKQPERDAAALARARALHLVAYSAAQRGDAAKKERLLAEALAEVEALRAACAARGSPSSLPPHAQGQTIAMLSYALAASCANDHRYAESQAHAERALAALRSSPQPWPEYTRRLLGINLRALALAQSELGDVAQGTATYREAVSTWEDLEREYPNTPRIAESAAGALYNLAITVRTTDPAESLALLYRAIEKRTRALDAQAASRPDVRSLGLMLDALANWSAESAAEDTAYVELQRVGRIPGSAQIPVLAARHILTLARAARERADPTHPVRPEWLDGAMRLLLSAEQRGWPTDVRLEADEFALLHDRAEFIALRARVAR